MVPGGRQNSWGSLCTVRDCLTTVLNTRSWYRVILNINCNWKHLKTNTWMIELKTAASIAEEHMVRRVLLYTLGGNVNCDSLSTCKWILFLLICRSSLHNVDIASLWFVLKIFLLLLNLPCNYLNAEFYFKYIFISIVVICTSVYIITSSFEVLFKKLLHIPILQTYDSLYRLFPHIWLSDPLIIWLMDEVDSNLTLLIQWVASIPTSLHHLLTVALFYYWFEISLLLHQ